MRKYVSITVIVIALAAAAVLLSFGAKSVSAPVTDADLASARTMSLEDYFKENISVISPEKEVLGGKFYVTKLEARGGAGIVWYEDGHNAYAADFTYSIDAAGRTSVETFQMRK